MCDGNGVQHLYTGISLTILILLRKFAVYNGNVFKLHDPKGIKDI
jgi:hypothetical protein